MPLYKYMMKHHLRSFLARGSLRIGTLHEYRSIESYGSVIGDDEEGTHYTSFQIPQGGTVNLMDDTLEAVYLRKLLLRENNRKIDLEIDLAPGAVFIEHGKSPDLNIYCATSRYDPIVMKRFGYDACLKIEDPIRFFREISKVIRHHGTFQWQGPIVYANKSTQWNRPHLVHPSIMKALKYSYQDEVRAIWDPTKESCRPLFVDVRKAIKFCCPFPL